MGQQVDVPRLVEKYCSACHLAPQPSALPRRHWLQVFGFMSVWIQERGMPFDQKEYSALLEAYEAAALESFAPIPDDLADAKLDFRVESIGLPAASDRPVITALSVGDLDGKGKPVVLVCEANPGRVTRLWYEDGGWKEEEIFRISAPSCARVFDYDDDGLPDIVVGVLGSVDPTDQLVGSVWLLRNEGDGSFDPQPLLTNCPRVTDVRAGDFNGDGKLDLLVAQFGWRTTGGVVWMEQQEPKAWVSHVVADMHGAFQSELVDWDGDGHLDFVTLFAQEYESVVLFRNDGKGVFSTEVLAQGPDPSFGSSSLALVDLDQDGDPDLLWTNGDMMDELPIAKPYHGLHWLENRVGKVSPRRLVRMPGCYRAVPYDLDGDGDLDIVVSNLNPYWVDHDFPSLIWLENDGRQNFTARRLLYSPSHLPSVVVGDFDQDGRPDIIVGGMHHTGPLGRVGRLTALLAARDEW